MASGQQVDGPLRGVNLGGWLVLEKWITPSLFAGSDAIDEYTFCQDAARREQLQRHHRNFVTEADFAWLAGRGVQAVRLPVGYWLFGDEPPYVGTIEFVDKAFAWAAQHGIKVLLDMHAAPGSQNGEHHSGRNSAIDWPRNRAHIDRTLTVLERLGQRYGHHPALLGISLLNEPSSTIPIELLTDFYQRAADAVRQHCHLDAWIVFSDSFRPGRWRRQLLGLAVDYHHYQIYTRRDRCRSPAAQLRYARWWLPFKIWWMRRQHPVIIGEWSLATAHEISPAHRRAYAAAQLRAWQATKAWFFWTYKTEGGGPWSFRDSLQQGWLPTNGEKMV